MGLLRSIAIFSFAALISSACGRPNPPAEALATTQPAPPSPTSQPPASTPMALQTTPIATAAHGLGLETADVANFFQLLGFEFRYAEPPDANDYVGTISDGLATVHLEGPEADLTSVGIVIDVPNPPSENQASRTMAYLAAVLATAADEWEEGTSWLNENLNVMGESRATFDGRQAVLVITPAQSSTRVELIIQASR